MRRPLSPAQAVIHTRSRLRSSLKPRRRSVQITMWLHIERGAERGRGRREAQRAPRGRAQGHRPRRPPSRAEPNRAELSRGQLWPEEPTQHLRHLSRPRARIAYLHRNSVPRSRVPSVVSLLQPSHHANHSDANETLARDAD